MGGNALKTTTRRYPANEYFALCDEVLSKLSGIPTRIQIIPAYAEKPDFGDMDILFQVTDFPNWRDIIKKLFTPADENHNGSVYSLLYKDFQLDFIGCPAKYFDTSLAYYSFNDIGNLMGVVANRLHMKYGHDGLSIVVRLDHMHESIMITNDIPEIFDILGFDYARFQQGFKNYNEIYEFIYNSRYFKTDMFIREETGEIERKRIKKRKGYEGFLLWLEDKPVVDYVTQTARDEIQQRILTPEIREEMELIAERFRRVMLFKERFSGDRVSEWLNISGKDLGEFMKSFPYKDKEFFEVVLEDIDYAEKAVREHWNEHFECSFKP